MKILVTGGSGKVGQHVMQELIAAGHWAVNVDQTAADHRSWGNYYGVDLTDASQVYDVMAEVKPDAVIHLAADPRAGYAPRHAQFMANVGIAHSVFLAASDLGIQRIVYASSEQANGWSSGGLCPARFPFDEDGTTTPRSAYSLGKLMGEQMLESFVARHSELTGVSLRINYVATPERMAHLAEWASSWPGGHVNFWAYVDARDAATAFRLAVEAPAEKLYARHAIYMVAASDLLTMVPTRDAVKRFFGQEIEVDENLPEFGSTVDCSRITKDLGWTPQWSWRNVNAAQRVE